MALVLSTVPASPWPVMTLPARSGTWATYTPRLWMDATRLANLRAKWVSSDPNFITLKNNWGSSFGTTSHVTMAYCLDYAATGNTANVLTAYNTAIAQEFVPFPPPSGNAWDFQIDDVMIYAPYAAHVLDWMWPALTATQVANLAARLEHFAGYIEGNLNTAGVYLPTRNMGNFGLMACIIAGNGEAGFTNRLTEARNFAQNQQIFIDEAFSDGGTMGYQVGEMWALFPIIMYLTASGELSLINSRCQKIANKGKHIARTVMANGYDYWSNPANIRMGAAGNVILDPDFVAWEASVFAGATKDPLIKWIWAGQMTSPGGWARNFPYTEGSWLALLYHDDALAQASQSTLPLSAFFPKSGTHNIRGGWTVASDVNVWYHVGPSFGPMHDDVKAGDIQVLRGETQLIVPGRTYPGRNTGWNSWGPGGSNPGNNSITCSCMAFEGSGVQSMHGDFSGGQPTYAPDAVAFPKIDSFSNAQATPCSSASVTSSTDDGTLTKIVADLSKSYPQITSLTTTFGMIRQGTGNATIVIYEQFVAPGTIGTIRRNFWGPPSIKPTISGETVVTGASSAGVLTASGDHVIITSGSSQVTIQCVTPMSGIDLVGGVGFESYFNGGPNNPITKAGNNQGDLSANAISRMTGIWRTSFRTTQAAAGGEMLFVLTVAASGSTAPSYTRTSALALLTPSSIFYTNGFETGDGSGLNNLATGSSIVTSPVFAGGFALKGGQFRSRFVADNTVPIVTKWVVRTYLQIPALPGAVVDFIDEIAHGNESGTRLALQFNASNKLEVQDYLSTMGLTKTAGTVTLSTGAWHRIELACDLTAGGVVQVTVDGTLDINTTHSTDVSGTPTANWAVSGTGTPNEYFFDAIQVNTGTTTPQGGAATNFSASGGVFNLTGVAATLTKTSTPKVLSAAVGALTLSGVAATLTSTRTMSGDAGAFSVSGVTTHFRKQPGIVATIGLS